jgi:hypothetical protein
MGNRKHFAGEMRLLRAASIVHILKARGLFGAIIDSR